MLKSRVLIDHLKYNKLKGQYLSSTVASAAYDNYYLNRNVLETFYYFQSLQQIFTSAASSLVVRGINLTCDNSGCQINELYLHVFSPIVLSPVTLRVDVQINDCFTCVMQSCHWKIINSVYFLFFFFFSPVEERFAGSAEGSCVEQRGFLCCRPLLHHLCHCHHLLDGNKAFLLNSEEILHIHMAKTSTSVVLIGWGS